MDSELINLNDYELRARSVLATSVYDFYAGGSYNERALSRNQKAFEEKLLLPRVLTGNAYPDTHVEILGVNLAFPVMSAPVAFQKLLHHQGESAMVRALASRGIAGVISTMASESLEKIAASAHCPLWFQLYIFKDRAITLDLIHKAEQAGYQGIVLTVDTPLMASRERDIRNHFFLPDDQMPENFEGLKHILKDRGADSAIKRFTDMQFDPSLNWQAIDWLRQHTRLPLILKGILHPEDAKKALDHGVDALIVSNHGGRQLDCVPAAIDALEAISKVIDRKIPLLVDGGIRRGSDIFVALTLGATAVLIGRPLMWGLAVEGQKGVEKVLDLFHRELVETMFLMGAVSVSL